MSGAYSPIADMLRDYAARLRSGPNPDQPDSVPPPFGTWGVISWLPNEDGDRIKWWECRVTGRLEQPDGVVLKREFGLFIHDNSLRPVHLPPPRPRWAVSPTMWLPDGSSTTIGGRQGDTVAEAVEEAAKALDATGFMEIRLIDQGEDE